MYIRRQEIGNTFGDVIEKTLKKKLPKLANTAADKRILLLERQHMILFPKRILGEIEKQQAAFPDLAKIDEVWIVETIFYGTDFGGTYLRFELYKGEDVVRSFDFEGGKLMFEDSIEDFVHAPASTD